MRLPEHRPKSKFATKQTNQAPSKNKKAEAYSRASAFPRLHSIYDFSSGEAFCSRYTSFCPAAGVSLFGSRMIFAAVASFPYKRRLASLSGRKVDPSREIPAKTPRARE